MMATEKRPREVGQSAPVQPVVAWSPRMAVSLASRGSRSAAAMG
jgi:hypothetical protein